MSTVSVSTVIPTYNSESTLGKAIDSVIAQDLGSEIVVVDDGSTDGTDRILQAYGNSLKVIRQPNAGAAAARNTGVVAASGEYLAFLDADDAWLPDRLRLTVEALECNPKAVLSFS